MINNKEPSAKEIIQHVKELLIGATCTEINFPSDIPFFNFGGTKLWTFCDWKLEGKWTEHMAGYQLDSIKQEELKDLLLGLRIVDVSVVGENHLLTLGFENGAELVLDSDADKYENWNLRSAGDELIVAGPRSALVYFPSTRG